MSKIRKILRPYVGKIDFDTPSLSPPMVHGVGRDAMIQMWVGDAIYRVSYKWPKIVFRPTSHIFFSLLIDYVSS